jgi:hypothetical protein
LTGGISNARRNSFRCDCCSGARRLNMTSSVPDWRPISQWCLRTIWRTNSTASGGASVSLDKTVSCHDDGHGNLDAGGHEAGRWRPPNLDAGGHEIWTPPIASLTTP